MLAKKICNKTSERTLRDMNFYKPYKETKMVCTLCQHYCKIKEGNTGICGVNKNVGGAIECLVYGYPSALNIDRIEKKPLYHFLPGSKILSLGTVGCDFKCSFCQNWDISQEQKVDKSHYYSPKDIVKLAVDNECPSIAYTYNEPTIFYPYARDIALEAKKEGIKSVYVSNGFESNEVIEDMENIIDAINIDLKSFDPHYYKKNLRGNLDKVLENIKSFKRKKIWIEITTLIVPTQNDSDEELDKIVSFIKNELGVDVPWHITAFHPDYKDLALPPTSVESLKRAYDIGKSYGLNYVYMGNITHETPTICPSCGTVLIQRDYFKETISFLDHSKCFNCGTEIQGVFHE